MSRAVGIFVLLLLGAACIAYYAILGEVEISFAQKPTANDAQEAARKLKLLTDAQSAKKNGFIRLSEGEINSLLQSRNGKPDKNRTPAPVRLVKAGVLLDEKDIKFVTWHQVELLGLEFPIVWQRSLYPERNPNGWSLALQDMRVGKVRIPRQFWTDMNRLLGATDNAFDEQKNWLAGLPTLMLSRNEVSRKPEVRLYTYIPMVKDESDPLGAAPTAEVKKSTNTLTAKLDL